MFVAVYKIVTVVRDMQHMALSSVVAYPRMRSCRSELRQPQLASCVLFSGEAAYRFSSSFALMTGSCVNIMIMFVHL